MDNYSLTDQVELTRHDRPAPTASAGRKGGKHAKHYQIFLLLAYVILTAINAIYPQEALKDLTSCPKLARWKPDCSAAPCSAVSLGSHSLAIHVPKTGREQPL